MKVDFHLTVNSSGSIRTSKGRPDLKWDEVTIACKVEVPDALFRKPQLSANIVVPNEAAVQKAIDATVADNFKEAIQAIVGTDVKINISVEPIS